MFRVTLRDLLATLYEDKLAFRVTVWIAAAATVVVPVVLAFERW